MRIIDPVHNVLSLGSDANQDTVGIVIKTQEQFDNMPMLGVVIPKFMMGYEFKDGETAKDESLPISGAKCVNDATCTKFWNNSINIKNYITVRPLLNQNQSMPTYVIGDKVLVTVIDNDIKTLAFLPYSINRLGQRATDKYFVGVPANPKENQALTEDNTYFIKMDSKEKVIILATSNQNGETAAQTIGMDAETGQIAITDNQERTWLLDTQNDSITSKTSGTTIEQVGNVINIKCDQMNIEAATSFKLKTSTYDEKFDTMNSEGTSVKCQWSNFTQTTDVGKWNVSNETHSGMAMSLKEATFHCESPLIGLNGTVIFPSFTVGAVPNINVPVSPVSGMCGPMGTMLMQTDPGGVPLAKFPQLSACLMAIAAAADAFPSGMGAASAAAAAFLGTGMTTKMMSS